MSNSQETIRCTLHFFGDSRDEYGLPQPFVGYLVVGSPRKLEGSGISSVVPLTEDTETPNPPHFMCEDGGPEKAIESALDALRKLHEDQRLREHTNCPGA